MPTPMEMRRNRLRVLKAMIKDSGGKITIQKVYQYFLESWGMSRTKINEYIQDLEAIGFCYRNDNHLIIKKKKAEG